MPQEVPVFSPCSLFLSPLEPVLQKLFFSIPSTLPNLTLHFPWYLTLDHSFHFLASFAGFYKWSSSHHLPIPGASVLDPLSSLATLGGVTQSWLSHSHLQSRPLPWAPHSDTQLSSWCCSTLIINRHLNHKANAQTKLLFTSPSP